ncbi:putative glycerol kinase 5 isoform X2 [Polyodon spathula]|uniref:putative glycerol kinase 5 isoform X2 n=1 Tax=Polyodon spathula TaxID=7913 RepID=UPI001B7EA813|nr:putative glycerol kinase 5 isoform X2 [Polyodon spathula]
MCSPSNGFMKDLYILSVDVGTTSIRGHVYDKEANIKGSSSEKISLLYPNPGWVELDPEELWLQFVAVVKAAVQAAGLQMKQITALGISTQRATFTTWSRKTGKPFHNFISWQDRRASELVTSWNNSFTMKVQEAVEEGNCCFGTVDTWLLYRLTKGAVHATDYSNASATGIFDSYQMCWSGMLCSLISLPLSVFPTVENTSHKFGSTDTSIFGVSIPIMSLVADQQAAMFGECCFDRGDVKITMGTGTFININTGNKPHASVSGLYPVVGWKIGQEVVYLAEGNAADTGTAIKWAQELDLFSDAAETEAMANSVPDADGVCFVPSFSGLQAPLNDPHACASFMGLKPSTTKSHLVRAILESIAFRNKQLYEIMSEETHIPVTNIRADGGVCNNNFVMQLTANLFNRKINRPRHFDMSSLGAAFIAGLGIGFWSSKEELTCLGCTEKVFYPQNLRENYKPVIDRWEKALMRSMHWYSKP